MKRWSVLVVVCLLAVFTAKQYKSAPLPRQALPMPTEKTLTVGSYRWVKYRPSADAEDQSDSWYVVKPEKGTGNE